VAEPFYVLLGDVIVPDNDILPRMKAVSDAHNGASVLAVFAVPYEQVSRFGVIAKEPVLSSENTEDVCNAESSRPTSDELVLSSENTEDVWRITSLVEKPSVDKAPSNLAIFGRYLLSPRVMQILAQTKPGAGGEIQLTDALAELLHSEEMYALVISSSSGFDTGTVQSWLETNVSMAQRRAI
jgi:UTP--glucose-1-phosphate uridylyltransferase